MKNSPATKSRAAALPPPLPPPAVLSLPRFGRLGCLVAYPFAVLQPGPGFALGLLYASQADPDARRFGRICLALSVLGFALRMATAHSMKSVDSGDSFLQPYN